MLSIRIAIRAGLLVGVAGLATVACAQPQPAPPPREVPAPTTAELLVGRWRMVKFDVRPAQHANEQLLVFIKDGKFSMTHRDVRLPVDTRTGNYHVIGDSIEFNVEVPEKLSAKMRILVATKTDLCLQYSPEFNSIRVEYRREEGK